jgi:hypothetical protein
MSEVDRLEDNYTKMYSRVEAKFHKLIKQCQVKLLLMASNDQDAEAIRATAAEYSGEISSLLKDRGEESPRVRRSYTSEGAESPRVSRQELLDSFEHKSSTYSGEDIAE